MGSKTLYSVFIYMLLSEDVMYASNVFDLYYCNHLKAMLFSLIGFETQAFIIICELIVIIISTGTLCM